MRARTARRIITSALALGILLGAAAPAQADHHLMKIRAIFKAGAASDFAFVQLQMTAAGQTNVSGTAIRIFNGAGTISSDFALDNDVANGESQRMVLVGESNVTPTPDSVENFQSNLDANAAAGAACFIGLGNVGIDCVSWGGFTGFGMLPSPASNPIAGGLSSTMVSVRNIGAGCATALDDADDTNSSTGDFGFAVGYPIRNNASAITELACLPPIAPVTQTPIPTPTTPTSGPKKKKCKKAKKGEASAAKKCKKKKK